MPAEPAGGEPRGEPSPGVGAPAGAPPPPAVRPRAASEVRPPGPEWDQREVESFAWADRWNGRVLRSAAIGFPVWLILLLGLGEVGAGPVAGFVIASITASVLVVLLDRAVFARAGAGWNDKPMRIGALAVTFAPAVAWLTYPLWKGLLSGRVVVWGGLALMALGGFVVAVLSLEPPKERR